MAERELKKMNRSELIEIIYALQKEEHELRDKVKQLEEKLTEKNIVLEKSGSIAEASLKLNKIFEDAQAAADQYIESVRAMVKDERFTDGTNKYNTGEKSTKQSIAEVFDMKSGNTQVNDTAVHRMSAAGINATDISSNVNNTARVDSNNANGINIKNADTNSANMNDTNSINVNDINTLNMNAADSTNASDANSINVNDTDSTNASDTNIINVNDTNSINVNGTDSTNTNDTSSVNTNDTGINNEKKDIYDIKADNITELISKNHGTTDTAVQPDEQNEEKKKTDIEMQKEDLDFSKDIIYLDEDSINTLNNNESKNDDLEELFNSIETKLKQELKALDIVENNHDNETDMFGKKRNKQNDNIDIVGSEIEGGHTDEADIFSTGRNSQTESIDIFDEVTRKKGSRSGSKGSRQGRTSDIFKNMEKQKNATESVDIFDDITEKKENKVVYPDRSNVTRSQNSKTKKDYSSNIQKNNAGRSYNNENVQHSELRNNYSNSGTTQNGSLGNNYSNSGTIQNSSLGSNYSSSGTTQNSSLGSNYSNSEAIQNSTIGSHYGNSAEKHNYSNSIGYNHNNISNTNDIGSDFNDIVDIFSDNNKYSGVAGINNANSNNASTNNAGTNNLRTSNLGINNAGIRNTDTNNVGTVNYTNVANEYNGVGNSNNVANTSADSLRREDDADFKYYDDHHRTRYELNSYNNDSGNDYNGNFSYSDNYYNGNQFGNAKSEETKTDYSESTYSSNIVSNYDYFNMWFKEETAGEATNGYTEDYTDSSKEKTETILEEKTESEKSSDIDTILMGNVEKILEDEKSDMVSNNWFVTGGSQTEEKVSSKQEVQDVQEEIIDFGNYIKEEKSDLSDSEDELLDDFEIEFIDLD